MAEHMTIISFFEGSELTRQSALSGLFPGFQVGQLFAFDHPQMKSAIMDKRITNIQHAVDLDGTVTTYVDVGREEPKLTGDQIRQVARYVDALKGPMK